MYLLSHMLGKFIVQPIFLCLTEELFAWSLLTILTNETEERYGLGGRYRKPSLASPFWPIHIRQDLCYILLATASALVTRSSRLSLLLRCMPKYLILFTILIYLPIRWRLISCSWFPPYERNSLAFSRASSSPVFVTHFEDALPAVLPSSLISAAVLASIVTAESSSYLKGPTPLGGSPSSRTSP